MPLTENRFSSGNALLRVAVARVLIGLLIVFGIGRAHAAQVTVVWDGGGTDNNWATADNWNPATNMVVTNYSGVQHNLQFAGSTRTTACARQNSL